MEVKCALCGEKEELTKIHRDYQRFAQNPEAPYFCSRCTARLRFQAQEAQKPKKPL